jgi:transposase
MRYRNMHIDIDDRILFLGNTPEDPVRPGIYGVNHLDAVDIDESGYYASAAQRFMGHSLLGQGTDAYGFAARSHPHLTTLIAVDARVGVIDTMMYEHGTTSAIFYMWVYSILIPKLSGTGRRVIMMDNLSSHFGDVVQLLKDAGHFVVFRPTHSPIFGPVEFVFHYVEMFLQQNCAYVTNLNLKAALEAAFDNVSPLDIAGYMNAAHMYVPGHEYHPWMGEI